MGEDIEVLIQGIGRVVPDFVSLDFCGGSCLFIGLGDEADIVLALSVTHEIIVIGIALHTTSESRISIESLGELVIGIIGIGSSTLSEDIRVGVIDERVGCKG